MARSGVIVIRNKDQHIPEKLKEALIGSCRAMGCAFVDAGKLESYAENARPSSSSIKESEDAFNFKQVSWFGYGDTDFNKDDLQPITLVEDANGNRLVIAFAEGDFDHFAHKDSARTNEHHMVEDSLMEKVNKVYEDCDEDLGKMMTTLEGQPFRDDMAAIVGPKGVVTLLCSNGDISSYVSKDFSGHVTGPWGWASKAMGYTEPTSAKPPVADAGSNETAAQKLARQRAERKAGGAGPSVPAVPGKTDTRIPPNAGQPTDNKADPLQVPPKEYLNRKETYKLVNKWWNRNFEGGTDHSKRPKDWEKGLVGFPYSQLKPNSGLRARKPGDTIPEGVQEIPPIISGKHLEQMNAEKGFLKDVKEGDPNLLNLASFNELEENYSSFFEQADYPIHMFLRWSLKKKREFVKNYNQAAYTALVDLCNIIVKQNPKLLEAPVAAAGPQPGMGAPGAGVEQTAAQRLAAQRAAKKEAKAM